MAPPVIPVFTSRAPGPPDPRRKRFVVAAVIIAIILLTAVVAAVQLLGPSSIERCIAEGGHWDYGIRQCDREESIPQPAPGR